MTKKPKQSATSATNNKICASVANPKRSAKPQKQFVHSWQKTQAKDPTPKTKQKKNRSFRSGFNAIKNYRLITRKVSVISPCVTTTLYTPDG